MMQRIYLDGKADLGSDIPPTWEKPAIYINHRCPKRVIKLINKVRENADVQQQVPGKDVEGFVRLFIVDANGEIQKSEIESNIAATMSEITNDKEWESSSKVLTLEHHMAANRGGFAAFFVPLYQIDRLKTGLLDGTLTGVSFFINQVQPLILAKQSANELAEYRILKRYSPLLDKEVLKASENPVENLGVVNDAVEELYLLWDDENDPTLMDILKIIRERNIFQIPDVLMPIASRLITEEIFEDDSSEEVDSIISAWEAALECSFSSFKKYVEYISDESRFGTHQGIKGLEFPHVMVILDDDESRGFLFKYEKLLGAAPLSETDLKNIEEGKGNVIDRTLRLFYVTCSRAEESLAIVAYTKEPSSLKQYVIEQGWFDEDEIL